jgi:glycosyltransferase involved in cell wall biosynthesis
MNPLVSIIVPSFQQAKFLRVAIDSILSQNYTPIEVLVLDGGSTDGSKEILESYGNKIWFSSGSDGGQCQAINEGFRRSQGEFVAWLNSDDFYYPGAIAHAVEVLQINPECVLVYGEGNLAAEDGSVMWRFPETVPFDLWRLANHSD